MYLTMKVLPHVMRNINEFNIPAENSHGYEISYNVIKTVDVTLIHNWQQEVKESQLKDYKVQ